MHFLARENSKCDLREIFFPFVRKASQLKTFLEHVVTQLGTTGLNNFRTVAGHDDRQRNICSFKSPFLPAQKLGKKVKLILV